jgi:thiamine biosynthesis lipoprotein
MRQVFATMGTMASLSMASAGPMAAVEDVFASYETRFSRYRAESELSAVVDGRLRLEDASPELRRAYAAAMDWRARTAGAFTPNRPDGGIDLDGLVKAEAMAAAGEVLDAAGLLWWTLAVGGDVLVSAGAPEPARSIGIADPDDRARVLTAVRLSGGRRAAATSGSAERGDHIWLRDRVGPADFVQATVVADDIVTADVLATAVISGGRLALDEICERWDVDILAVAVDGSLRATPGLRAALALPLSG